MKTGSRIKVDIKGNKTDKMPGKRLELLVNNVCDVVGLRKNLKELNLLADFSTSVMSCLKLDDVLTAAAWKFHEYFQYKLLVYSEKPDSYANSFAFYTGRMEMKSTVQIDIIERCPGLKPENIMGYDALGLSTPRSHDIAGINTCYELPLDMGFVWITTERDLLENHSDIFIKRLLETMAICLRNACDYQRVKNQSMRDSLTGLFNRRVLEEMLELEQRKRDVAPLSLLLIDLDNFKSINDNFGHAAGDAVLQSAAGTLRDNARGSDLVVRYGGEEFAVLLPSASASIALEVGERLRKCIEQKEVEFDGHRIRVTASLGIAHRSGKDLSFPLAEIMSHADQALYQAKNTGKNRVCFYSSSPVLVGNNMHTESDRSEEQ